MRKYEKRIAPPSIVRLPSDHMCYGCVWASVQGQTALPAPYLRAEEREEVAAPSQQGSQSDTRVQAPATRSLLGGRDISHDQVLIGKINHKLEA